MLIAGQRPLTASGGNYLNGLTHWYPLTDATISGATATDVAGGADGTLINSPTSGAGPNLLYPQGREFVRASLQNVSLPTGTLFDWNSGDFTLAYWLYQDTGTGFSAWSFLDSRTATDDNYVAVRTSGTGVGQIITAVSSNAGTAGIVRTIIGALASNTWTHFILTNAGSGAAGARAIYLNGASPNTLVPEVGSLAGLAIEAFLGAGGAGVSGMDGRLAGVRVFNRRYTNLNAQALYHAGG